MGLLQRDKDGCWKRPQEEKTGGAYRGLWVVLRSRLTAGNGGGGVSARGRDRQGAGPTGSQPPHLPPHPIPQPLARHPAYLLPPPSSVLVLTCPYPCRPGCAPTVRSPLPEHTYIWQIPQKTSPFEGSPHKSLAPASRGLILLGSTRVGTYSIIMASNVCVFSISHPSFISSHPFKVSHSMAKTYQAPTDPYPPFTRTFLIQSVLSPALPLDGLFPSPIRARPLLSTPH